MVNSNVTTITLDGNETKIEFSVSYPYYQITNRGDTDIYVSLSPNITPETEGVYTVSAGGSEIIGSGYSFSAFYVLGTGKAYIRGKPNAMPASFKIAGKGGGGNGKAKQLILLKSTTESSEKLNGLTGFELINTLPSGSWGIGEWNGIYGVAFTSVSTVLEKAFSLYGSGSIDSALFATLNEFNLTDYNYILIDFYSASNYGTGAINNFGGSYFRLDEPTNFPQSTVAYDWSEWDAMGTENCQQGLFVKDISQIEGSHKLYFGVHHGTYSTGYSNALALLNIILF